MTTWAGALVETRGREDLAGIFAKHRITLADYDPTLPWLLIDVDVNFAHLNPPKFAEELSNELHARIIGFFLQSTASVEQIEHWEDGRLLRKLEYSADEGGWLTQFGSQQPWEPAYFFADDEGVEEGENWPLNLGDEVTDEELARYKRAREQKDAAPIMDLLSGGSAWSIHRLCAHFGVDPAKPGARFTPPTNWKPRLIRAGVILLFVGMSLLGALTHR
jgi:hypothetical protein